MSLSLEREIEGLEQLQNSSRDPEGRGFVPLADAYRRRGDLALALEVLADGLDRHPHFASAYVVAARVHRDRGDHAAANAAWAHVLGLDSENAEALEAVAQARAAEPVRKEEAHLEEAHQEADEALVLEEEPAVEETPSPFQGVTDAIPLESEPVVDEAPAEWNEPVLDEPPAEWEPVVEVPVSVEPPEQEAPTTDSGEPVVDESVPATFEPAEQEEPPTQWSAPAVAEVAPPQTDEEGEGLPATRTLAELLVRQGFLDRAVGIYEQLLSRDPGDPSLSARLAELRGGDAPVQEAPRVRPRPIPRPTREEETEDQAEQMSRGGRVPESAEGLFVWSGADASDARDSVVESSRGGTIGEYFARLLAWTPAAVELVQEVASEARDIVDAAVDLLTGAEDDVTRQAVPIESLAPDAVPIESLAPGEPHAH